MHFIRLVLVRASPATSFYCCRKQSTILSTPTIRSASSMPSSTGSTLRRRGLREGVFRSPVHPLMADTNLGMSERMTQWRHIEVS
jgi:hypothetical protein